MAEQTSIWKKEIHLRRTAQPPATPVAAKPVSERWETPKRNELWEEPAVKRNESTAVEQPQAAPKESIWKKEISFGKKVKAEKVVQVPPAPKPKVEVEKTSIWKKEITLAKKPKAEKVAEVPPAPKPKVEVEKTSIWKKEITLSKKPKADKVVEAASVLETKAEPESDVSRALAYAALRPAPEALQPDDERPGPEPKADVEKTSIWKKEISFGKKPRPADLAEPVVETQVDRQPEPLGLTPWGQTPVVQPETSALEADVEPEPEPEPASAVTVEPVEHPAEQAPVVQQWPMPSRVVEPEPVIDEQNLAPSPVVQKWPVPSRVVEPEPVTEEQDLAPSPVVEQKTPIWKKEISFGKKPKQQAAPKEQPAPKQAEERKSKESMFKRELRMPRGPQFRREPKGADDATVLGLRIGSSQLAAALVYNNGSAELQKFARAPLERGLVSAGEVRDADALAKALKQFFSKHKLPRRGVRLGVATNRIGVRVIEMPLIDDPKLLGNAVRFRAQEVVPIPLAEAVLDYVVLGVDTAADKQRVLLVFAHRELVDGYLDACKRAGLKLTGIDFDAFALLRALSDGGEPSDEKQSALIAVSIGHERTIFAVSAGAVCDFARVLDWGGSSLDSALARALDIPLDEAEALKQELSLSDDARNAGLSPIRLEAARAALRQELQVLARELMSSLQFYQSRPESLDIGEILLTGGGAELDGLGLELGKELGVPVHRGDPLRRVTFAKGLERPQGAASLAIAVGLGIES